MAILTALLSGWVAWFFPHDDLLDKSGTPLGADFSMFYVSGQMVGNSEFEQLYDPAAQQAHLHRLFPDIDPRFALPYRYPPIVALVMASLAQFPYRVAVITFLALGVSSAVAGCWLLLRETGLTSRADRRLCCLVVLGWPVVLETWIGGQSSLFTLLIMSVAIVLMQREKFAWSGAVWALAACKPNVLLLLVAGCVLHQPRILRGLIPAVSLIGALTWAIAGWQSMQEYWEMTLQLASRPWNLETPPWKVHGLAPWLAMGVGSSARLLTLGLGLLATTAVVWRWRRAPAPPHAFLPLSLLITINALANPYTPIYDLTLLAAGAILMIPTARVGGRLPLRRHPGIWQAALATLYFGPHLSQLLAQAYGVQVFPLLLLGYAIFQARLFWRETATMTTLAAGTVGRRVKRIDAPHGITNPLA